MAGMTQQEVDALYAGIYGPPPAAPTDGMTLFANGRTTPQQISDMYGGVYNPTAGGMPQPPAPASWDQFYQGILPPQQQQTRFAAAPQHAPSPKSDIGGPTAFDTLASLFGPSASSDAPLRLAPNQNPVEAFGHGYVAPSPFDYQIDNSVDASTGKRTVAKPVAAKNQTIAGPTQAAGGMLDMPLPVKRPQRTADVPLPVARPQRAATAVQSPIARSAQAAGAPSASLASLYAPKTTSNIGRTPIALTVHAPRAIAPAPRAAAPAAAWQPSPGATQAILDITDAINGRSTSNQQRSGSTSW